MAFKISGQGKTNNLMELLYNMCGVSYTMNFPSVMVDVGCYAR